MSTIKGTRLNSDPSDARSTQGTPATSTQTSENQGMADVARDAQGAMKQTVQETMGTAKEAAQDLAEQTQERAAEVISQATEQTTQMVGDVKEQVTTSFTEQRDRAVVGLESLANALREAGKNLEKAANEASNGSQAPAMLGPIVEEAADRLAQSATFLRDKDMTGLLDEAQNLARKQPLLFMGAMFGIGVVGSRLLKGAPSESANDQGGQSESSAGESQRNSTTSFSPTGQSAQPSTSPSQTFKGYSESMPAGQTGVGFEKGTSAGSEGER